jgi:hypothetical protein
MKVLLVLLCFMIVLNQASEFEKLLKETTNTIKKGIVPFIPNSEVIFEWKQIIKSILTYPNECKKISLGKNLKEHYQLSVLDNEFCVLRPKTNVRAQWGTLIVKMNKNSHESVHIQCPHPITDGHVLAQSFAVFKNSKNSKSLLISGTMRNVSLTEINNCQKYYRYDVAHNDEFLFQKTTEIIPRNEIILQFHGMADSTCEEDVFISNGFKYSGNQSSGDANMLKLTQITRMVAPNWRIENTKTSNCKLVAASNVQGRFFNGVERNQVCHQNAQLPQGNFIHIEQKMKARDDVNKWIEILNKMWN